MTDWRQVFMARSCTPSGSPTIGTDAWDLKTNYRHLTPCPQVLSRGALLASVASPAVLGLVLPEVRQIYDLLTQVMAAPCVSLLWLFAVLDEITPQDSRLCHFST